MATVAGEALMFEGVRRWYWLAGAGLVLIAVAVFLLRPEPEEPRARQYHDVSACLLTDQKGLNGSDAAAVWAGMQDASAKTLGQVRFLAISGPQDVANGRTFVGSLVLGRCAVIVAAGALPVETVNAVAREHPDQKFLIVGGAPAFGNVSAVSGSDGAAVRAAVTDAVTPFLKTA